MEQLMDDLSERTDVAENVVKFLKRSCSEIESRQRNLDLARESVVERMMEIEFIRESLEKGLKDLEEKEMEFSAFKEGKKRKLALEEEEFSVKKEELLNDVKMREEKLDKHLVSLREQIERLEVDQKDVRRKTRKKMKEIECKEENLRLDRESLAERERKVDVIIGSLDERIIAVEKRENEFNLTVEKKMNELALKEEELSLKWQEFVEEVKLSDEKFGEKENEFNLTVERKMSELESKEEQLSVKWQEFVKEVELVNEKFEEKEKLKHGVSERLEFAENKLEGLRVAMDERLKEIESRGDLVCELVAASVREADLIRESMEKQLEEFEKEKREFYSFQEDKMQELNLKKQHLKAMSKKLYDDAKFRDEELIKRERRGNQLLKRLKYAEDEAMDLKVMIHERFKQIGLKETEVKSIRDWVEVKLDELDFKGKELEEKEMRIITKEDSLISSELEEKNKEFEEKKKELYLKEKNLESWQKELEINQRELDSAQELNEKRSKDLDRREKSVNSVREFIRSCYREHRTIKAKLGIEKDSVEKRARDLDLRERELNYMERGLEFKEKQLRDRVCELEPDKSADLKFLVRMDGKTLQMFLNDPEKDLESMGDEIFKVLHLSSDPAKLVLDAMVGFYPPRLRKGDLEVNVRRTCIIVLQQFIKMSKAIQPCIREKAIELAGAWKSKMRASAENSLEVLGFLHLLAAYNLGSYFGKDEILSFLMMIAQCRQRPLLCRVFGFTESITD